jgi:hypothetical protein
MKTKSPDDRRPYRSKVTFEELPCDGDLTEGARATPMNLIPVPPSQEQSNATTHSARS